MTAEEQTKIDLCGVWRNGLGQDGNPILLHVSKFDIGYDMGSSGFDAKAHVAARILKFPEGGAFPKRIEMVMPQKKCFVILIDTLFSSFAENKMQVALTGFLYGRSPLSSEPDETATLVSSITTHTKTDERLPAGTVFGGWKKTDDNTDKWPIIGTSKTKWGTGETINIGDSRIEVITAPVPDGEIEVVSQVDLEKAWGSVVSDFGHTVHKMIGMTGKKPDDLLQM